MNARILIGSPKSAARRCGRAIGVLAAIAAIACAFACHRTDEIDGLASSGSWRNQVRQGRDTPGDRSERNEDTPFLHAPLIIAAPTLRAGSIVDRYVTTIDLLPTILVLYGRASSIPDEISWTNLIPADGHQLRRTPYAEAVL